MSHNLPDWARDVALRMGAVPCRRYADRAELPAIRDALRDATGRHPRPASALFDRVREDWGPIDERRMWRLLGELLERGEVVRVGRRHASEGYVRGRVQA